MEIIPENYGQYVSAVLDCMKRKHTQMSDVYYDPQTGRLYDEPNDQDTNHMFLSILSNWYPRYDENDEYIGDREKELYNTKSEAIMFWS